MPLLVSQPHSHPQQRTPSRSGSSTSFDAETRYARSLTDLRSESDRLIGALTDLFGAQWLLRTGRPKTRSIKDRICQFADDDDVALFALTRPDEFQSEIDQAAGNRDPSDSILEQYRALAPETLLAWCIDSRHQLMLALRNDSPDRNVAWFRRDVTVEAMAAERLVETWTLLHDLAVAGTDALREAPDSARR
jgi:hypothetical protein